MKRAPLFILLLIAAIGLFGSLGSGVLYWDEAIYAQVSKEMIQSGDCLTPHWNGHVLFHKPPLYFWATAAMFRIFGTNEFVARAMSSLSGMGVIFVSYLFARRIYGQAAGILTGFILLSSQLFVSYARFGTTDTMLTFFVLLALYGYLRAEEDDRFWLLACSACGMALMAKGAAGVVAPSSLLLAAFVERRALVALRNKWLWAGVACATLVVLPWHAAMYWLHGNTFIRGYFFEQVLERATTDLHEYRHGYGYYLGVLWEFFWPWVYLLPFAVIFGRRTYSIVLLILAVLVTCLYTLAQTKFQWYILPAVPAFSIIISCFIVRFTESWPVMRRRLVVLAVVLLWIGGTAGVIARLSRARPEMEAASRLARLAAGDEGAIAAYPENLEMTVKFYSGRKLCADQVLNRLSYSERTECLRGEARHMIFRKAEWTKVETRFTVEPKVEYDTLVYAAITPNDVKLVLSESH